MFSNNEKISARQIKRLMLFDLFGISSLLLPAQLAQSAGNAGVWSLLLAVAAGCCYIWILGMCVRRMQGDYFSFLQRVWGKFFARLFYAAYAAVSIGLCIYTVGLLSDLMCSSLLKNENYNIVFFLLLLLGIYGAAAGVEARARIYELLFWILLIPFVIMLLLCIRQIQIIRWFPFWNAGESAGQVITGAYQALAAFLPVSYLVFLIPYAKEPKKAGKAVYQALIWTGGALCILFLILTGIFGASALSAERYPIITLLGMVKLPGGFLKRLDTVMASVWFFTLYALLTTALYYGALLGKRAWDGKRKQESKPGLEPLFVTGGAVGLIGFVLRIQGLETSFWQFFYRFGIPFLLILPPLSVLLAYWRSNRSKRRAAAGLAVLVIAFLFTGCSNTELENKSFPLAMLLEQTDEKCQTVYLFQKLSEISNERTSGGNTTMNTAVGDTYFDAQKTYEKNNRCQLDVSHTKAIVLSTGFFENEYARTRFLEYVHKQNLFARNTLLYLTSQDIEQLAKLNEELEVPLGSYLEQMTENEQDIADTAMITLGKLLNESENKNQLMLIPVIKAENGLPIIYAYYAVQDFEPIDMISVEDAMIYFLLQEQLKEMDVQLDGGVEVRFGKINCERLFLYGENSLVQKLTVKADAECITGACSAREVQQLVEQQIESVYGKLIKKYEIDITDSYRYLPMYAPKIWQDYKDRPKDYRKALNLQAEVQVRMLQ